MQTRHPCRCGQGRVTPGLGNIIRSGAGLDYPQIGIARPGVVFDVLDGPVCADGYWWWRISYQGTRGWTVQGDGQEDWIEGVESSPQSGDVVTIDLYYQPWNRNYQLRFNPNTCYIENGGEVISESFDYFYSQFVQISGEYEKVAFLVDFFSPHSGIAPDGEIEAFRQNLIEVFDENFDCEIFRYQVSSRSMDSSGLGNIVFGYYAGIDEADYEREDWISNQEQAANMATFLQFYDNTDDLIQRLAGRRIAENYGAYPSIAQIEEIAMRFNLR